MPYCASDDLLTGDIPVVGRAGLDVSKFIQDAADEIDSKIGFRYATPVAGDAPRPVLLLLKRINSHLATGRLIMAADAAGQRTELHAYGVSLIREAHESLDAIAAGTVDLDVAPATPVAPSEHQQGPLIFNVDPVSQVESFYGAVTALPGFTPPSPYPYAGR
jgi:phage gp36-like protein